jgi:hypothetical protein
MTDKQIIYNCPHISLTDWGTYACKLYNPRDKNCLVKGGNCDSNISCPYKQLDQLKAENEGFKILHKSDKGLITATGKQNYQLLQEYDKLKTENKRFKETLDELFKIQYKLADNNKKLRQCLTEIKEIAEKQCVCGVDCIDIKQILQKISECGVSDD